MSWFRLVNFNAAEKKARLDIYDSIGEYQDWWTGEKTGLSARAFSSTLQALGDDVEIELHINSPGGSVPDGIQIANELKRRAGKVTAIIDGQAASIASIIAVSAHELVMPANSTLWIHDPAALFDAWGYKNSEEMRATAGKALNLADSLDTMRDALANTYAAKAGDKLSREEIIAMMAKETTITAEQAVAWGLADRIEEPVHAVAMDPAGMLAGAKQAFRDHLERSQPPAPAAEPAPPAAPPPMEARAVIAACRAAHVPQLASEFIDAALAEPVVAERLALAGRVRDLIAAAGLSEHEPRLLAGAMGGPVEALRAALSLQIVNGEASIRANHGSQPPRAHAAKSMNVFEIIDRRNNTQRKPL